MNTPYIDTQNALDPWLQRWSRAPFLALDTEFVREQTYYAQLCLVQIGDGEHSVCIDPLAGLDLQPLWACIHDAQHPRVFHAAGQDLEILVQLTGRAPSSLFDTQIAAGLLGMGDQIGYAALIEKQLGIRLDKSLSRTNWARRPLNERETTYATDDVRHLAVIYPDLRDALQRRGRLHWLQEDCATMADPKRYRVDPEREWRRLKGLVRLPRKAQHVAARLAAWRDVVGEQRNRPRRWILPDEALYALAERQPQTLAQLGTLQALPPKTIERHGRALIEMIEEAGRCDAPPLIEEVRLSDIEKQRIRRVQDALRVTAERLEISVSLLAPRADIEALALLGADADIPLLRGWRREAVGAALLEML
ncbi:ribonuclease D [Panacagrimonas sp.]|uniref:ribonuclease D n=1 Tax=Panacagrimonas sp. TaxID=2480088 RepID=UPI003B51EA18